MFGMCLPVIALVYTVYVIFICLGPKIVQTTKTLFQYDHIFSVQVRHPPLEVTINLFQRVAWWVEVFLSVLGSKYIFEIIGTEKNLRTAFQDLSWICKIVGSDNINWNALKWSTALHFGICHFATAFAIQ
jgi:hypothetical protein